MQALVRLGGREALDCVAAAASGDDLGLVRRSAALLAALTLIWAARGIEPDEVWMELHKRERLGSLLHDLARREAKPKRRARPWRVDSTKLP